MSSGIASTWPYPASPAARGATIGDRVTRDAYSQEVISFGFWAGDDDLGDAAYYSYTAPDPDGLRDQPLAAGDWIDFGSDWLALLPYETVQSSPEPRTTVLAFCQSAYEPALASPAGTPPPSHRPGARPRRNSRSSAPPQRQSSAKRRRRRASSRSTPSTD